MKSQLVPGAPAGTASEEKLSTLLAKPEFKLQLQASLPKHLTPDRFVRVLLTAINKTPKLAECTRESLFAAFYQLSAFGLEADGRRAHLIPYGNQCTLIIDYKGLAELAMRSGDVSNLHADKVCANDIFVTDRGLITKHQIDYKAPRGDAYAYYAICRFKDGTEKAEVMTKDDVEKIRKRSRAGSSGPWVSDFDEMAKKTVFRRLSKWLPLSPEFRDAAAAEDERDAIDIDAVMTPGARFHLGAIPAEKSAADDREARAEALQVLSLAMAAAKVSEEDFLTAASALGYDAGPTIEETEQVQELADHVVEIVAKVKGGA